MLEKKFKAQYPIFMVIFSLYALFITLLIIMKLVMEVNYYNYSLSNITFMASNIIFAVIVLETWKNEKENKILKVLMVVYANFILFDIIFTIIRIALSNGNNHLSLFYTIISILLNIVILAYSILMLNNFNSDKLEEGEQ